MIPWKYIRELESDLGDLISRICQIFFLFIRGIATIHICAEYIVRTLDYLEGENIPGNSGAGSRNRPLLE